jgi:ubiquitin-protein ligase E3 B
MRIVFNTLEGNYALCLLANLIQLAYVHREDVLKDVAFPTFTVSNNTTFKFCSPFEGNKLASSFFSLCLHRAFFT